MKKTKSKKVVKKQRPATLPVGKVAVGLVLWDFSQDDEIVRHCANELARIIQLGYNLENFSPSSFGIEEE